MNKKQYGNVNGSLAEKGHINATISGRGHISGNIGKAQTVYVRELEFDTRFNFPNIGDEKTLYIATDENRLYRWFSEESRYVPLNGDSQNVLVGTSEYWNGQQTLVSAENVIYVYSDYGMKIGDGTSYLSELPFTTVFISDADKANWNDKVGARIIGLETLELYK